MQREFRPCWNKQYRRLFFLTDLLQDGKSITDVAMLLKSVWWQGCSLWLVMFPCRRLGGCKHREQHCVELTVSLCELLLDSWYLPRSVPLSGMHCLLVIDSALILTSSLHPTSRKAWFPLGSFPGFTSGLSLHCVCVWVCVCVCACACVLATSIYPQHLAVFKCQLNEWESTKALYKMNINEWGNPSYKPLSSPH